MIPSKESCQPCLGAQIKSSLNWTEINSKQIEKLEFTQKFVHPVNILRPSLHILNNIFLNSVPCCVVLLLMHFALGGANIYTFVFKS